jgi:hypothetical protein
VVPLLEVMGTATPRCSMTSLPSYKSASIFNVCSCRNLSTDVGFQCVTIPRFIHLPASEWLPWLCL